MIDDFSFVNNQWFWHIVIVTLLLWIIFAWKEWKQDNKSKLYLKLVLSFIALLSLAIIVLKPLINSKINAFELAILTEGYDSERLDSLKKANKNIKSYTYTTNEPIINANQIPSSIYILGEGIAPSDFWQIDTLNTTYLGDKTLSGITKLKYKQEQILGDFMTVRGLYTKAKKGTKLILQDAAKSSLDSIIFGRDSTYTFQLSTKLNIAGNYEYYLTEKDSINNVIQSNPFGISVISESKLNILIVNGFPTFETKYLKNYLAEKGHELVVRSQITRGKFKYEYFNINTKPLVDFSDKSLEQYDLVIIDYQSFRNFGTRQKQSLEQMIKTKGLGLFIQSSSTFNRSKKYITDFKFQSENSTNLELNHWPKVKISKYSYSFNPTFALQAIHKSDNSILSAYKALGNGRIGTSVINNTFELLLNGNTTVYQGLWTETINALSKKKTPSSTWKANSNLLLKNEPFNFQLRTTQDKPILLSQDNEHIPLLNDIDIQTLWKGKTYPKETGWLSQRLEQDTTQIFQYYINNTTHWKSLKAFNTMRANKVQFKNLQTSNKQYTTQKPMSLYWLYIVFLLCIGYLWLEPKL